MRRVGALGGFQGATSHADTEGLKLLYAVAHSGCASSELSSVYQWYVARPCSSTLSPISWIKWWQPDQIRSSSKLPSCQHIVYKSIQNPDARGRGLWHPGAHGGGTYAHALDLSLAAASSRIEEKKMEAEEFRKQTDYISIVFIHTERARAGALVLVSLHLP